MSLSVRNARHSDGEQLLALLPRLADFALPARRDPRDLWLGDEALLRQWLAGDAPQLQVHVAADAANNVLPALTGFQPLENGTVSASLVVGAAIHITVTCISYT